VWDLLNEQLKNDKDVAIASMKHDTWVWQLLNEQLKNDEDVVLAYKQHH